MHFAIDQDPATIQARKEELSNKHRSSISNPNTCGHADGSSPVKLAGSSKRSKKVEIVLQDVYQKEGRVYLRYAIVNGGRTVYLPAAPEVFTLNSPRACSR